MSKHTSSAADFQIPRISPTARNETQLPTKQIIVALICASPCNSTYAVPPFVIVVLHKPTTIAETMSEINNKSWTTLVCARGPDVQTL